MTLQIALLLAILALTLLLFSLEWVSADIIALGVLLLLILTGLLPVDQAFAGFGSDTVILILGLLIMTAALVRTGVVEMVGRVLAARTSTNSDRLLLVVMSAAAGFSSFMSNTAATAFFVPIVIGMARRARVNASRLLMPLAFASILASSVTLIGTSTNIVVSGLMTHYGLQPIGMFELTPVGIPIVILGIAYMFWIGRRLIPERSLPDELTDEYNLSPYLTEISILPGSPLIGKTLDASGLGRDLDLTVLRVLRDGSSFMAPQADLSLEEGDVLLVEGQRDNILKIKGPAQIGIAEGISDSHLELESADTQLAEVVLLPRSPLIGRRLVGVNLRENHGIQVLAINRHEETIHTKIGLTPLRMGDVLLVQGPKVHLTALERNNSFRILGKVNHTTPNYQRARLAVAIFVFVLILATLEWLSLPVAMILGALLAFLTRCITPEEAYADVEWKAIILIGSMLAFGTAMEYTGAASYLANLIVHWTGNANPIWLLSGFFLLTVLLTQPMSNQAAAVVVLPVAIEAAASLGLNPRTFAMMIAVAASTSFITPLEPACLIIYGLGRYRFIDFIKVGTLLTLIVYCIAILLVPMIWPVALP